MVAPKNGYSPAPGTGSEPEGKPTALQSHVAFFDPDGDGVIWPSDTYLGFRALTFGVLLSLVSMIVIHTGFSYVTWGSILPDPCFRLKVKNMHRGKHGSDTEAYTSVGEFDEKRFDSVFKMYSSDNSHLTLNEGICMLYGNRNVLDLFGWFAAAFEWTATYIMLSSSGMGVKKEDVKAIYNGSIFYRISGRTKK